MQSKAYLIGTLFGSVLLLIGTTNARAQIPFPPPGDYTLNGTFTLSLGGVQGGTCSTIVGMSITDSTSGTLNLMNFLGGGICSSTSVTSIPNTMIKNNNTVTIIDMTLSTSIGDCHGDLDGMLTITASNNTVLIFDDMLTMNGLFFPDCLIGGVLDF